MSNEESVLSFLEASQGKYVSGGEIASVLGVSRNAVWKSVKKLEKKGYEIRAVTNKGYMLASSGSLFSAYSVKKYITHDNIRVQYQDSVTSTNTLVKEMAEKGENEGLVLIAAEQTEGTGAYFSILLRPQLSPSQSLLITTCAAVAVAKAIEKNTGRITSIKWVNDIYMRDKKVSGILTQAAFDMEGNKLNYAVLGIGINMYFEEDSLSDEIRDIAGAVFSEKPDGDTVSRIVADTVNIFFDEYRVLGGKHFLFDYVSRSYLDGKRINVISPTGIMPAEALGIDDDFRLHVRYDDMSEEYLSSGEVSTRVYG